VEDHCPDVSAVATVVVIPAAAVAPVTSPALMKKDGAEDSADTANRTARFLIDKYPNLYLYFIFLVMLCVFGGRASCSFVRDSKFLRKEVFP